MTKGEVARRRAAIDGMKRERGCDHCGTREGRLDYHHRQGEIKLFNVAHLSRRWESLLAEIAKCDLLCVCCHAREHMPSGEANRSAKLTASAVREIRAAEGSQRELARRYGVSQPMIGRIRRGEAWKAVV